MERAVQEVGLVMSTADGKKWLVESRQKHMAASGGAHDTQTSLRARKEMKLN